MNTKKEREIFYLQFINYMKKRIAILENKIRISRIITTVFNFLLILFNFVILVISILIMWWALEIVLPGPTSFEFTKDAKLNTEALILSMIIPIFTILLFVLSIFISGYKITMKWEDYRKFASELQYISTKIDGGEYLSKEQFNKIYNELEKKYIYNKVKFNWKKATIEIFKGNKGAK